MDRIENAQMNSLGTRKLYYENVHQTDFTAVVMECVPDKEEGYYRIVLDASAFFPGRRWSVRRQRHLKRSGSTGCQH